jgi:hypothetical protein
MPENDLPDQLPDELVELGVKLCLVLSEEARRYAGEQGAGHPPGKRRCSPASSILPTACPDMKASGATRGRRSAAA